MIAAGRVEVDGLVVTEQGRRVDPRTAVVRVDGARVNVRPDLVYLALNKPRGVLSAMSDRRGRPTVGDLVAGRPERLFHIGRLDADTEGLLLLTNDGELAHRLTHPSFGIRKTYLAEVPAPVRADVGRRLRAGIVLDGRSVDVDAFRVVQRNGDRAVVEIVLHEGRKHVVRRLLSAVGHPVTRLVRTEVGGVRLAGQRSGTLRELTREELAGLHRLIDYARAGRALNRTDLIVIRSVSVAVRAIRGAIQIEHDGREEILAGTTELVREVLRRNDLADEDVISIMFTATPDLTAEFPAYAARALGLTDVPLICATEISVPGAMPRVLRLLAHVETPRSRAQLRHVYLRGAAQLRTDLPR